MSEATIGVAVLVYKETIIIDCIKSFIDHVDQVVICGQDETPPELIEQIKAISPKVEYHNFGRWIDDFSAKRNFSFSFLKTEWYCWVDADDIIINPERLKILATNSVPEVGAIWFPYIYASDEFGSTTTLYERERLLRARYGWIWKGRLHETVSPLNECQYVRTDEVLIKHNHLAGESRGDRNFRILNIMHKEDPDDKRVWLYLGHQHFAGQMWMEAAQWYLKFGTDEGAVPLERWQALCYCSKALREMKDRQAVDVALMAIDLFPEYKDGYCELAQSYLSFGEFDKAIHFANLVEAKELIKEPPAVIFVNPLEYTFNRYALLAQCYVSKNQMQEALQWANMAYQIRPTEDVLRLMNQISNANRQMRIDEAIKLLAVEHHKNKEIAKLPSLLATVPFWYRDTPDYLMLERGSQKFLQGIEDKPEVVEIDEKTVTINLSKSLKPVELLDMMDKKYDNIKIVAPIPSEASDQTIAYSQKDIEDIIVSREGRHIKNLQITNNNIVCEYDHKIPDNLTVRMFVGQGIEYWSPDKIRKLGEGGSETSAAWVCRELAKSGCKPLLYAMDNQVWDGVIYRRWQDFVPHSPPCDLFISSRQPVIFNNDIPSTQKYLWAHDIHCGASFTPEIAETIDAVICLSHWHTEFWKRSYPFMKDAQVIDLDENEKSYDDLWNAVEFHKDSQCSKLPVIAIIGDGILIERFKSYNPKTKVKNSFIWLSSPDRGLEQVLTYWADIKKQLPDAILNIFYGWNYFNSTLWVREQRILKEKLRNLIKQDGVVWRDRIGQDELAIELMKSDFLLYPPPHDFRETYGIAFLEAQAAGVICFYRQNGALGETISNRGIPLAQDEKPESIISKIVEVSKNREKYQIMRKRGRAYAMNRDWSVQTNKLMRLYQILNK